MGSVSVQVDLDDFLGIKSNSLVVVNFYAKEYKPSEKIEQSLKHLSKKFVERVTFVPVDVNATRNLADQYEVIAVPTFLFFKNKSVVDRINGADQVLLEELLNKHAHDSSDPGGESPLDESYLRAVWNSDALQTVDSSRLPPPHLLNDILTELSILLSPSTQARVAHNKEEPPISAPTLTLYCPIEGGECILDATVKEIAEKNNANVQVLDIGRLATEQCGRLWTDLLEPTAEPGSKNQGRGYFSADFPLDPDKLENLVENMFKSSPPGISNESGESEKRSRLIYLRDFGFLATFAPDFCTALLVAVRKLFLQDSKSNPATPTPTAIIIGASPLLSQSGLFQQRTPSRRRSDDYYRSLFERMSSFDSEPPSDAESTDTWNESSGAQSAREQRLQRQLEMWKSGTLLSHVQEQLTGTEVFPEDGWTGVSDKLSRACVVIPATRSLEQELAVRERRRLEINQLQAQMALLTAGGDLCTGPESQAVSEEFTEWCKSHLISSDSFRCIVQRAINTTALSSTPQHSPPKVAVTWEALSSAWKTQKELDKECSDWVESSTKKDSKDGNNEGDNEDECVRKVKKMSLNTYEKDMLRCIVKPADLQTTFDSVHLPEETIDSIRSLVSLPLLHPTAFQTGILKQYSMTGALLFGPPGTGKTLIAKAVAKESGSRMIAVKPSDIMDKYVGESEKIVSGLFKLARRLKPCIIFIDEIDALFGARTSKSSTPWRTDLLTQFAQEMDGMLQSDVVVIGTTNRPFDLDDAMIRRLSCRILVDLPDEAAREAILKILLKDEQLDHDVDLSDLARKTQKFSGSDLKSMCVAAAYESAKESITLPWVKKSQEPNLPEVRGSLPAYLTPPTPDSGRESPSASSEPPRSTVNPKKTPEADEKPPALAATSQDRKLSNRHFSHALKHVRASTSELQESLVELRKWNSQFGSVSQGKTGGYGAVTSPGGYGVGTPQGGYGSRTSQGGYGAGISQGGYGAGISQGGYGAGTTQGGYGAGALQGGYGAGTSQGGYGAVASQGDQGTGTLQGGHGTGTSQGGTGTGAPPSDFLRTLGF